MASTADSTHVIQQWKEDLKEIVFPELDRKSVKEEYLGSGLYGDTSIFRHNGVTYTAKKIHSRVFSTEDFRNKFSVGCLQLSTLRHPHVAQFLGVQITDSFAPILITEFYPLNFTICFQRYPDIPNYSRNLILLEVSLGLQYLHQLPIPVVHGHLCPNNILLTECLHVKISDSIRFDHTSTPSNAPYQPPEEGQVIAGDIFCLGDIILHIILQKEISPLEYKHHRNPENANEPVILKEIERRQKFLDEVEETHQLKTLVLRCLEEEPEERPITNKVSEQLRTYAEQNKPEYRNVLDMFIALGQLSLMKDTVSGLNDTVVAKDIEIEALKIQMEPHQLELQAKDEVITAQKKEVEGYKQVLQSKEGKIKAQETAVRAKEALIKAKDREIAAKKQILVAKEFLLNSTNKRVQVLEKHVKASRQNSGTQPLLPDAPREYKRRDSNSMMLSPNAIGGQKGSKGPATLPRNSNGASIGDSFTLPRTKSISNQTDPKLAKILARQHQKVDSEEGNQQQEPVVIRRRSKVVDHTTEELKNILMKRKSYLED